MRTPNYAPWINIAVGILTIISPFAVHTSSQAMTISAVIAGIVIAAVAIIELAVSGRSSHMAYWPVVNILAGIWLFISTSLAAGDMAMIWSSIALGVIAIVTALVALGYERVHADESQPMAR